MERRDTAMMLMRVEIEESEYRAPTHVVSMVVAADGGYQIKRTYTAMNSAKIPRQFGLVVERVGAVLVCRNQ